MLNYKEQLADSRWLKKKNEILERDGYTCQKCGRTSHLNVHHMNYEKGKLAWEYPNEQLVTLCEVCHENEHKTENKRTLEGVNIGDWYCSWVHEFRDYGIVFHIDYITKTIFLFGMNEGSFGCSYIYSVKYKDFNQNWSYLDIFEPDINDEDECPLGESDYFSFALVEAFDELMRSRVSIIGYDDGFIISYAQHYMPHYIKQHDCFVNACIYRKINYDYV